MNCALGHLTPDYIFHLQIYIKLCKLLYFVRNLASSFLSPDHYFSTTCLFPPSKRMKHVFLVILITYNMFFKIFYTLICFCPKLEYVLCLGAVVYVGLQQS